MTDKNFDLQIHHLTALAFVPFVDIIVVFGSRIELPFCIENDEEIKELANYFKDILIVRPEGHEGLIKSIFQIAL